MDRVNTVSIRFPNGLYEVIKALSEKENRSFNKQVIHLLREKGVFEMGLETMQSTIETLDNIVTVLVKYKKKVKMTAPIKSILRAYPYLPPNTNSQVCEYVDIPDVQDAIERLRLLSIDHNTNCLDIFSSLESLITAQLKDMERLAHTLDNIHTMQTQMTL